MYNCFNPGKVWLDTKGERIQAHGGSIMYLDGTYYWYGEDKSKSTAGSGIWHWGVRCYKSEDLYNWEDLGTICPANEQDPEHPLHFTQGMDRPHIIFNEKTGKFVLWIKIMQRGNFAHQYMVILTSDKITGPYENMKIWEPDGFCSGDFDLVKDKETGKACIYFDTIFGTSHTNIAYWALSDDYTSVTGEPTLHMDHPGRFIGREAPAFFERNGKKYIITSQTTGYMPNRSECFCSDDYNGEWENLGYIHENDVEGLSFRSQLCSVFKHPEKKELYIALADRWLPNMQKDMPYEWADIADSFNNPDKTPMMPRDEYLAIVKRNNSPETRDTSIADYVWLPIEFENGRPVIRWYDSWKVEDFE